MSRICFIDTETTGLDPRRHDAWEIAVIRREDGTDTERLWQVRPNLADADPEALEIGKFHSRFSAPDGWDAIEVTPDGGILRLALPEMLFDLQEALAKAVLVGSNPAFDDAFLKKLLHAHGRRIGWHYRTVDVATLAAGYLHGYDRAAGEPTTETLHLPWSSRTLSRALGVEPPGPNEAHTALADARWARDVFDAATGGAR